MEIVVRHRNHTQTESGGTLRETELAMSDVDSTAAALISLSLANGVYLNSEDLSTFVAQLKAGSKVDIAASAVQASPVRRRIDFNALSERAKELARGARQWSVEKWLEYHATIPAIIQLAAGADQLDFTWEEVTGEDILETVNAFGGIAIVQRDPVSGVIDSIAASFATDYDFEEMSEVLESLEASGTTTPKKLVGDLAQTSITTSTGQEQIISLAEWSISWKRKTVDATTTDDALYESSLGSSKSWTAKAKYMFVDGDQSQIDGVLSAIDTTALDPLVWNFFPTVELGRQAFSGKAFIDGIDIGSGSGKIVGLDVSLKGSGPLLRLTQVAPIANSHTVTGVQAQV